MNMQLETRINNIEFIANAIEQGNKNFCMGDILNEIDNIRKEENLQGRY
jgi:hypothetical protein